MLIFQLFLLITQPNLKLLLSYYLFIPIFFKPVFKLTRYVNFLIILLINKSNFK